MGLGKVVYTREPFRCPRRHSPMVSSRFMHPFGLGLFAGLAFLLASASAHARKNGIASMGCSGCHSGGTAPTVTITSNPPTIMPGATVTLTVNITTPEGYAGFFMMSDVGTIASLAGQGTQLISGGVTHTAPKKAVNGVTSFQVGWTAPSTTGSVNLNVWAVAANGDGSSRGDGPGQGFESFTFGCTGTVYWRDFDNDGYGAESSGYTRACTKPTMFYASMNGDCNDSDERVYPGAKEMCNKRDDNCNGQIDEGLAIVTCHVDNDGDGHGVATGATMTDCGCQKGYAPNTDDCNDNDPTVYTGADELCDYKDNNCNGQVDENARVACGMGWCRRLGAGCDSTACTPGEPRAETCNAFDDDCDGVNDNGTDLQLCGAAGMKCVNGTCINSGSVPDAGATAGAGGAGAAGTAGVSGQGGGSGQTGAAGEVVGETGAGGESSEVTGAAGTSRNRATPGCAVAGDGPTGVLPLALAGLLALVVRVRRRR